jgi:hypothetical protein
MSVDILRPVISPQSYVRRVPPIRLKKHGYYAPINVMPDPREGRDTQGIDLISLLLGRGFYFI